MAKLKNVTHAELEKIIEDGFDLAQVASDLEKRAGQGYCDEIKEPLRKAASILSASRALADLGAVILTKAQLIEQKAELERTLRARSQ